MALRNTETVTPAVAVWLAEWRSALTLWLEAGVSAPGARAREALGRLIEHPGSTHWPELRALGGCLLGEADLTSRAAALLDLITWVETAAWHFELARLDKGEETGERLLSSDYHCE